MIELSRIAVRSSVARGAAADLPAAPGALGSTRSKREFARRLPTGEFNGSGAE